MWGHRMGEIDTDKRGRNKRYTLLTDVELAMGHRFDLFDYVLHFI